MSETCAAPDVRQLREDSLPRGTFPPRPDQDFRIFLAPSVHEQIRQHAGEDTTVEICGILVGRLEQDDDGPFAAITECIRSDVADSRFAEVTFTHEAWSKINHEMDTRFVELQIVGWYHSHPDFGIFLSDRDAFIQQHFFSGPGQVAYVVDPVRKQEGVFVWRDGKPTPSPHYWIGSQIRKSDFDDHGSEAPEARPGRSPSTAGAVERAGGRADGSLSIPIVRMLALTAAVLVGYWLANWSRAWEYRRLVEGTVAHYGIWKGLRPGLADTLDVSRREIDLISQELAKLSSEDVNGAAEGDAESKKRWKEILGRMNRLGEHLERVKTVYGLTPEEAAVVEKLIAERIAELNRASQPAETAVDGRDSAAPARSDGGADSSPSDATPVQSQTPSESRPRSENSTDTRGE